MPSGDELKHIRHPFRRHPAGREARRRLTPARLEPRQLQEPRTLARSCGDGERSPSPNGALAPAAREPGPHSALGQDDMLWEGPPRSLEVPPAKGAMAGEACRGSALGSGQRAAARGQTAWGSHPASSPKLMHLHSKPIPIGIH